MADGKVMLSDVCWFAAVMTLFAAVLSVVPVVFVVMDQTTLLMPRPPSFWTF